MTDISQFDEATKQYFDTLPAMVQETIVQSDVTIQNRDDLERCAAQLMQNR